MAFEYFFHRLIEPMQSSGINTSNPTNYPQPWDRGGLSFPEGVCHEIPDPLGRPGPATGGLPLFGCDSADECDPTPRE